MRRPVLVDGKKFAPIADELQAPVPPPTGAVMSKSGAFRYVLWRHWNITGQASLGRGWAVWIMLNPSTADERVNDPTCRRVIAFSQRAGFAGAIITNLFAFRTSEPKELVARGLPIGPMNIDYLRHVLDVAAPPQVICAWGVLPTPLCRPAAEAALVILTERKIQPMCFGLAGRKNDPRHPLYYHRTRR